MKTIKRYRILVFVMLITMHANAQFKREPEEKIIADLMERLIENEESTIDYTDLQEQLEYYIKYKLDINKAERYQLERLIFLTDRQINAILKHRIEFGEFITIYELQTIEELDERTLYYLSYFVTTNSNLYDDQTPFMQRLQKGKHEILALRENDFQTRAGYDPILKEQGKSYYLGSPFRYVLRYRFNYSNNLSFGYTGEKDMGEPAMFDFNSFHFLLRDKGKWKVIALGDYQINIGQGLTFGSGLSARKSTFVLNVRRSYQTIRTYRSLNENEFMRGAAATYKWRTVEFTGFASSKYISTNYAIADSLNDVAGNFSSIQLTGLHRTATEIANKNNVLQQIIGTHVQVKKQLYEIGFTGIYTQYNSAFLSANKPYQLYNFNGKQLTNIGIDYQFQLRNNNVFGECSMSDNGALAGIIGLSAPLHQSLDMVFVYRNYARNYLTTFNNPFGENSDGRNEEGFYTGLSLKLNKRWLLNSYVDYYRSTWLRYLVDAPSHGTDYLMELQYNPSKQTQFYVRYRSECKNKNQSNNISPVDYTSINQREQYRFNGQYKFTDQLSAKTRLEIIYYQDELSGKQQGTLLFQDLFYNTSKKELSIGGRIAVFTVDDYNARVYATEQDVLYQYAVPLYQNSGIRYYGVVHFRLNKQFDCWLKYSQTQYSNVKTIGSGLEQINGNTLSDLRMQVRLTF